SGSATRWRPSVAAVWLNPSGHASASKNSIIPGGSGSADDSGGADFLQTSSVTYGRLVEAVALVTEKPTVPAAAGPLLQQPVTPANDVDGSVTLSSIACACAGSSPAASGAPTTPPSAIPPVPGVGTTKRPAARPYALQPCGHASA